MVCLLAPLVWAVAGDIGILSVALCLDCRINLPMVGPIAPAFLVCSGMVGLYAVRRMSSRSVSFSPAWSVNAWFSILFLWIGFRWLMDPTLPRAIAGASGDVTGFRTFFDYLTCLIVCVVFGVIIRSRPDFVRFLRGLGWVSVGATFVLLCVSFAPIPLPSLALSYVGVYPVSGTVGSYRYVSLPGYGMNLLALAMLPTVCGGGILRRLAFVCISGCAILAGANRISVLAAVVCVLVMLALSRRPLQLVMLVMALGAAGGGMYLYGEYGNIDPEARFTRLISLVSRRAEDLSGSSETVEWRLRRWRRAYEDITKRPVSGHGFQPVKGIFNASYQTYEQREALREEMDVAIGGTHNGYISMARLLGIPAVILFVGGSAAVFMGCARAGFDKRRPQLDRELCIWCAALLAFIGVSLMGGSEIHFYNGWMPIGLGILLLRWERAGKAAKNRRAK